MVENKLPCGFNGNIIAIKAEKKIVDDWSLNNLYLKNLKIIKKFKIRKIIKPMLPVSDNNSIYILCGWDGQEMFFFLSFLHSNLNVLNPEPIILFFLKISIPPL